MLISTGKQIALLTVLCTTPYVWFNVNEVGKFLENLRLGQYSEIIKSAKEPERILRFFFSSGICAFLLGATYLNLPLKFFMGWIPFVGRIDDFIAKSFVTAGVASLAIGFGLQTQI